MGLILSDPNSFHILYIVQYTVLSADSVLIFWGVFGMHICITDIGDSCNSYVYVLPYLCMILSCKLHISKQADIFYSNTVHCIDTIDCLT